VLYELVLASLSLPALGFTPRLGSSVRNISYLEARQLMLLLDVFLLYRDTKNTKQRVGPDLLLMPYRKPTPSAYDLDVEPPPLCAIEITSPKSHQKDLTDNVKLYMDLDIPTYLVIETLKPNKKELREQFQLHVFRKISGQTREIKPDTDGYLVLPEMGLKIGAQGQLIVFIDKITGETLLDMSELKMALGAETQRAQAEARRAQAEAQRAETEGLRAETEAQRALAEARRAKAEAQRAEMEAQRADAAEQRAKKAFFEGEQERAREIAGNMLAKGIEPALVAQITGFSREQLAILPEK
jgi:nucleoid-associated protein YgaU